MTLDKGDPADVTVDPPDEVTAGADEETCETTIGETEAGIGTTDELPLDVIFDILKNHRRRLVIRYLSEISATTTLSDLAEHIAARENDKSEDALTSAERKRVYVCLYQCHLPKMNDAGLLEFEPDRGTVELADNVESFTRFLDFGDDDPDADWPLYYIGLSAIGGTVFVGQRMIVPSDVLSGIIIGVLVGLFVNLALEHALKRGVLHPPAIRGKPTRSRTDSGSRAT